MDSRFASLHRSTPLSAPSTPLTTTHPTTAAAGDYPFGFVALDEPASPSGTTGVSLPPSRRAARSRSPGRGNTAHSRSSSVSSHVRVGSVSHSRPNSRPPSRPPSRGAPSSASGAASSSPRSHRHTPSLGAILARATGGGGVALPTPVQSAPSSKPGTAWRMWRIVKPWLPLLAYGATSLGFLLAVALWKTQVFTALDHLSQFLQTDGWAGYFVLYSLIFITTIPPVPLYSTLIVLSGYTFGAIRGLIVSYLAALTGALAVFLVSRLYFKDSISRWFSQFVYLKRVVRAIEKRPKLLFLIRVAPYPYNVMNCLLAASPTLTLRTYALCTALSLFKLLIHTTVGSTIHSFSRHYLKTAPASDSPTDGSTDGLPPPATEDDEKSPLGTISTVVGVVLCVSIFLYLSYVARKAVDDELGEDDDDELEAGGARGADAEERVRLMDDAGREDEAVLMAESPFRPSLQQQRAASPVVR